jgi:AcrR family transcriptional regulator
MSSSPDRPTRRAILVVAMELLQERGPDGFTIEDVLIRSGTSASSLYHHFGNREGLLLAAQEERYRQTVRDEDRGNLEGGFTATTTEEFCDYLAAQMRRIVTDAGNREVRRNRVEVAGRALHSPDLAEGATAYQNRMLDAVAEVFDGAQARGLIDAGLDIRAYCAWFHSMTLGYTFIEGGPIDADAWLSIAIPAALAPLIPARREPSSAPADDGCARG